jgi:hypothetical protein
LARVEVGGLVGVRAAAAAISACAARERVIACLPPERVPTSVAQQLIVAVSAVYDFVALLRLLIGIISVIGLWFSFLLFPRLVLFI